MKRKRDVNDEAGRVRFWNRPFIDDGASHTYSSREVTIARPSTEKKYFDASRVAMTVSNVAASNWDLATNINPVAYKCLFCPVQGTDINQRIGKKVQVTKIMVRGTLRVPKNDAQATVNEYTHVRLILMLHKQCNGLEAVPSECINSTIGTGLYAMTSFQNVNYLGKFRVLKDKTFRINPPPILGTVGSGTIDESGYDIPFKIIHIFRKPLIVHFTATAGSVADIVSNSLSMCAATQLATVAYQISYTARTTYMDY